MTSKLRTLILLLRRDLRLHDNPLFHTLAQTSHTHLLPLYVFNPAHIEVSGFLAPAEFTSPYAECRSRVGGFWRCGPHRATFIAEAVWDLKTSLKKLGCNLVLRVGQPDEVVSAVIQRLQHEDEDVVGVWMAEAVGSEERKEENGVRVAAEKLGVSFRSFEDGGYLYKLYVPA